MDNRQDEYLSAKSYEGHSKLKDHPEFSTFVHEDKHYFAMLNAAGKVVLRSQGYSSESGRDNGIQSVIKNRSVDGRYSIEEEGNKFFSVLKAGNSQEIARSAAYDTKAAAQASTSKGASSTGKGASVAAGKGAAAGGSSKSDGKAGAAAMAGGAVITGRIISENRVDKGEVSRTMGKRKLVKENRKDLGEKSRKTVGETRNVISESRNQISENRVVSKKGMAIAAAAMAGPAIFSLKNKAEYKAKALPARAAFVPTPIVAPKVALWPLLFLLLPLLFFFWPAGAVAPAAIAAVAPVVAPVPVVAAAPVCDCDAHDHRVFKLPKERPTKIIKRLGTWPEFGNSHHLDAPGFYNKLKTQYANNAVDKKFLDEVFNEMGFNGFQEARASDFAEVTLKSGVIGNLGGGPPHKTYYSQLIPTDKKDLEAFKITAKNGCHLHFMKTCGNHMFTKPCPADAE